MVKKCLISLLSTYNLKTQFCLNATQTTDTHTIIMGDELVFVKLNRTLRS